jgi:hypothetical protein
MRHSMRRSWVARLLIAGIALMLAARDPRAHGQASRPDQAVVGPDSVALQIGAPPRLVVGSVAAIEVTVWIADTDQEPLLLTPSVEGEAVRVVRGRLLRDDAVRGDRSTLVFALPLSARRPGAALLRIALLTYRCESTCREVRADASRMLEVNQR